MKESGLILQETFSSQQEEQRRERFQREFGRYIADSVLGRSTETAYDQDDSSGASAGDRTKRGRCRP